MHIFFAERTLSQGKVIICHFSMLSPSSSTSSEGKAVELVPMEILPPSFMQVPVTKYSKHKGCFKAWLNGLVWQRHASGNL